MRPIAFKCSHCQGKCRILKTEPDILSSGDIKVIHCQVCGAIHKVAITHIETLYLPDEEKHNFECRK